MISSLESIFSLELSHARVRFTRPCFSKRKSPLVLGRAMSFLQQPSATREEMEAEAATREGTVPGDGLLPSW